VRCVSCSPTALNASFIALASGDRIGVGANMWEVGCVYYSPTDLNAIFIALVFGDGIVMIPAIRRWYASPVAPPLSRPPSLL